MASTGHFINRGSANIRTLPHAQESLDGRMGDNLWAVPIGNLWLAT